ncbi:hypothetical protein N2599_32860 (plasmid) [Rhizobium sullae]|uniref:Uncharacterized protein n=1 Tax=Rhizobium sullae TaxID=50338 RepID=A0ABY5XTW7_RHISU|nr:hypothetical protein [Rhizobium sullae]UWU17526.1 hypothetical protein N2599_32860 [Rhizobium sullae]
MNLTLNWGRDLHGLNAVDHQGNDRLLQLDTITSDNREFLQTGMAMAHLFARRFDEASLRAEKSFNYMPTFLVAVTTSAANHALAGRSDKAQEAMNRLR